MEELLFNTLRLIPITINHDLTDEDMVRAITLNENIKSAYGYTFKPTDLVKIAKSDTDVWAIISNAVPEVKAKPMYPDFPSQVMEIDEAEYRFHQICHYFSTYGLEALFGIEVKKGWVPDVEETKKVKEDKSLLDAKVLEVFDAEELYEYPLKKIIEKKQRMTIDERKIVNICVEKVDTDLLKGLKITFKENLLDVFMSVVDNRNREDARDILATICQHTGDVLKCIAHYLGMHRYKISTSQKKLFVKLLESYPASDFKTNIMRSNLNREEVLNVLRYIDYNRFSRSFEHKKLVASLRNKELSSWYGDVEKSFKEDINKALNILKTRPGEFLRRVNEVLKRGAKKQQILDNLVVDKLSTTTLVRLNTFFNSTEADDRFSANKFDMQSIFKTLLYKKLITIDTPIKGKKVYVEEGTFDFFKSTIETNDKSEMGGYIVSGLAYKIPDEVKNVRFFTYWDDKEKRVDIDLHAKAVTGEKVDHVGWNSDYKKNGMVMSGDMTNSNSAEFIDVDLETCDADYIVLQIHDYTRYGFNNIETVLCGLMGVSELGLEKDVKLYTPKNCFFSNEVNVKNTDLQYGFIDVKNRVLKFIGKPGSINSMANSVGKMPVSEFSLNSYLDTLFAAQNAQPVEREEAEIILRLDKGEEDCTQISLIDENFFLDV